MMMRSRLLCMLAVMVLAEAADVPQFTVVTSRSLWAWTYSSPDQVSVLNNLPFLALNQTVRGIAHYRTGPFGDQGTGTVVISNSTVAVALHRSGGNLHHQQLSFSITKDFSEEHIELLAVSFVPNSYRVVIVAVNRTLSGSSEGVVFLRSENGGLTWEPPVMASGDMGMGNWTHQASIDFQERQFERLIGIATVDSRAYRSSDGISWVVCQASLPGVAKVIADPSYVSQEDPMRMMLLGYADGPYRTPFVYHLANPGDGNITCQWTSYPGQKPPPIDSKRASFTGFADRYEENSNGQWVITLSDGNIWSSFNQGSSWIQGGTPYYWVPGDYAALVASQFWYALIKVSWGNVSTQQPTTAFVTGANNFETFNWTINIPDNMLSGEESTTIVGVVAGFPQALQPSASPSATPSATPSSSPAASSPAPSTSPSPSPSHAASPDDKEGEYRMLGIGLACGFVGGLLAGVSVAMMAIVCWKWRKASHGAEYRPINDT